MRWWALVLLGACSSETVGLDDPRRLQGDAAVAGEDAAEEPPAIATVPCPAGLDWPEGYVVSGGRLRGELTVQIINLYDRRGEAGVDVTVERGALALRGTTDAEGCVRFVGPSLAGPVRLRFSASGFEHHVEGLDHARAIAWTATREQMATGSPPRPPPPTTVAISGHVTGWDLVATNLNGRGPEIATVEPLIHSSHFRLGRGGDHYPDPPPRPLHSAPGYLANQAVLGPPPAPYSNYALEVYAEGTTALLAVNGPNGTAMPKFFGLARGLSLTPGQPVSDLDIELTASAGPLDENMHLPGPEVLLPPLPSWAARQHRRDVLIYLRAEDSYHFRALPLVGPLASGEYLARAFASDDLNRSIAWVSVRSASSTIQLTPYRAPSSIRRVGGTFVVRFEDTPPNVLAVNATWPGGGLQYLNLNLSPGSDPIVPLPSGAEIEVATTATWLDGHDSLDAIWSVAQEMIEARASTRSEQTIDTR